MWTKSFILPTLMVLLLLIILQLIPTYINPSLLSFNDRFFFGYFAANNLAIVILVAISYLPITILGRSKDWLLKFISIVFIAAVLSNLLDRIFRGGAIDYVSIGSWPTFNIADILIVITIIIWSFNYLMSIKTRDRSNR